MITILKTDEEGGLQMNLDGIWVDINPIPGTFIVNIGRPRHLCEEKDLEGIWIDTPPSCSPEVSSFLLLVKRSMF